MNRSSKSGRDTSSAAFATTVPPFIGRKQPLDWFEGCLRAVLAGRPQVVLIQGDAGVGKTRLLKEVRSLALRYGIRGWSGRFYEDFALPYLPFVEFLLSDLERAPQDVQHTLDPELKVINQFLHRAEIPPPSSDGSLSTQAEQDKLGLFLAVSHGVIKLAQNHPLLLVLDDLHWADRPSLDLFIHLVFAVADTALQDPVPLLLVGSYRPVEPEERLARTITRFQQENICRTLELPGLNESEIEELIHGFGLAHPSHQLVTTINEATQGNPLFVQEVLYHLLREDALQERAGYTVTTLTAANLDLPQQVTVAIAARAQGVSQECRSVLTLASFLGDHFSIQTLTAVSGVQRNELVDLLEEGLHHRLLLSEGPGYQFAHPLIRHVFYSEPSTARRQRIHQEIAQTLERLYTNSDAQRLLEIAHHLIGAGPAAEPQKIVEYARRAGDQAFSVSAWSEAAHYYEAALSATESTDHLSAHDRAELHYRAGLARYRDLDAGPCLDHYEKAVEQYRRADDLAGQARALMEKARAHATIASVSVGTLVDLQPLEEVLNTLGDTEPGLQGRSWAVMANVYWTARQPDKGEEMAQRALRVGQRIKDDQLCAYASFGLGLAHMQSLCAREALESYESALAYARRTDDSWLQGWPLQRMPLPLMWLGRLDDARVCAAEACEFARESHDWSNYPLTLALLGSVAVAQGDFVVAERYTQEALVMMRRSHYPWSGLVALSTLACAHSLRGAWAEAEDALGLLVEPGRVFTEVGPAIQAIVGIYRQLVRAHSGALDAVKEQLAAKPWGTQEHAPPDMFSLANLCAVVELSDLIATPAMADGLYQALSRVAERGLVFSFMWMFLLPRILGVAATLNQWWEKAEAHFQTAIEIATRAGARPELGRSYLDYARMLVARGRKSDRPHAIELVRQANPLFHELGMEPFSWRTAQLAEALKIPEPLASWQSAGSTDNVRSIFAKTGVNARPTAITDANEEGSTSQVQSHGKIETISTDDRVTVPIMDKPQREAAAVDNIFRREGEYWTLGYQGICCRLKDTRGLHYIAFLLRSPGQEFYAAELVTAEGKAEVPSDALRSREQGEGGEFAALNLSLKGLGDAGILLDTQAKTAYKRRLDDLREEWAEAQRFNDPARAAKAQAEIEFLTEELTAAAGLGNRPRRAASITERARLSVTKAIKASLEKIRDNHAALGQHLVTSIRTGTFCSYAPDPTRPIAWIL